jgi:hypothetical protein
MCPEVTVLSDSLVRILRKTSTITNTEGFVTVQYTFYRATTALERYRYCAGVAG